MATRTSALQHELHQRRPFQSVAHEAVVALMRTADLVRRQMTALVAPHGITLQQYNVLRILRGAGDAGLPTLEIASRMIEKSPGITRLLDRLQARRLVRRVRCPHDRRQVLCRATAEAGRLLAGLDAPMVAAAERALAPLDATDTLKMIELLDAIRAERNRRASQGEEH